jgi:hypothetical protein
MPAGFRPPQQQQQQQQPQPQPNLPRTPVRQYVRATIALKNDARSNLPTAITRTLHTVHHLHRAHRHTHQRYRDKLAGRTMRPRPLQASGRRARTITVFRPLVFSFTNAPHLPDRQIGTDCPPPVVGIVRESRCPEVKVLRFKVTTTQSWAILQQICTMKRSIRVCSTLYYFDTSQIV